jgi:ketosteroid isomerase-like protein
MTSEEQLIKRYFDAFNRHDLEGVVACFHNEAVLVSPDGKRLVGIAEVRRSYEKEFALFPDAHCDLRVCTGNSGRGVAESYFTGTRSRETRIEAIGAEVMEIVDGKIKEIRDYHHAMPAKAAQEAGTGARS